MYTFLQCSYSLGLVIGRFVSCAHIASAAAALADDHHRHSPQHSGLRGTRRSPSHRHHYRHTAAAAAAAGHADDPSTTPLRRYGRRLQHAEGGTTPARLPGGEMWSRLVEGEDALLSMSAVVEQAPLLPNWRRGVAGAVAGWGDAPFQRQEHDPVGSTAAAEAEEEEEEEEEEDDDGDDGSAKPSQEVVRRRRRRQLTERATNEREHEVPGDSAGPSNQRAQRRRRRYPKRRTAAAAAEEEEARAALSTHDGRVESVRSGQDGVESRDLFGEDGCRGLGLLTAMVVMEAVLFGLFTMCMLCDQTAMLTTNETKIDRLKGGASISAPDAKVRKFVSRSLARR